RDKIPQIEVAIGDDDCVLAVRVLDPPTGEDREKMRSFAERHGFVMYLQPQGPDSIVPLWPEKPVLPSYSLPDQELVFQFKPTMFTQVNTAINRKMVNRVLDVLDLNDGDTVLDLFCGLGNFTLPMARKAGFVVGVEGDRALVAHARANARMNQIGNVEYHAADLTKEVSGAAWLGRPYNKILLDPSRAGAAEILPMISRWNPDKIVYVSCNPATFARDAGILVRDLGYRLVKAGVMDMFPQTAHVESIALFEK
ncbi:MAG: 23S rRNA (uracil(1939)-C(5))-methyltransferase RlmD, partial [Gammaproteobacteria bacterium]